MAKTSRKMHGESKKRTLTKTITYRILIIITDIIVLYLLTGSTDLTLTFVIASNAVTAVQYYFHERVWNGISWGRR